MVFERFQYFLMLKYQQNRKKKKKKIELPEEFIATWIARQGLHDVMSPLYQDKNEKDIKD